MVCYATLDLWSDASELIIHEFSNRLEDMKRTNILLAISLLAMGVSVAMAENNNGDKSRTPSITFNVDQSNGGMNSVYADMEVDRLSGHPKPYWYWAYQGGFEGGNNYYFGMQPNGEYGKTALFSIFGAGTQGVTASCKSGADSTNPDSGTSCHIPYIWQRNHRYTFKVALTDHVQGKNIWTGTITDTQAKQTTTIGAISVPDSWKLISPTLYAWAEWYAGGELSCAQRTHFTIGYSNVGGHSVDGAAHQAKASNPVNDACATYLFGNDHYMVTMDAGGAPTYSVQFSPGAHLEAIASDIWGDTNDELDLTYFEAKRIVYDAVQAGLGAVDGLSQAVAEKLKRDLELHGAKHVMVSGPAG
jgi:hypothetical protein